MLNKNIKYKKLQLGRSMIEMLGVLAIMAVITVLSIMAYTTAMRNMKLDQIKNDLNQIAIHTRSINPMNDYTKLCCTPGGLNFKSAFVDTGLMKNTNGFGYGDSTNPGYSLVQANPALFPDHLSRFQVAIYLNPSSEVKDCKLLLAQDWSYLNPYNTPSCGAGFFRIVLN